MINPIDVCLDGLRAIDATIALLNAQRDEGRAELQRLMNADDTTEYKNERATAQITRRASVTIKDEAALIADLKGMNYVSYVAVIPEHEELTKAFHEHARAGLVDHPLVTVKVADTLVVKFAKGV